MFFDESLPLALPVPQARDRLAQLLRADPGLRNLIGSLAAPPGAAARRPATKSPVGPTRPSHPAGAVRALTLRPAVRGDTLSLPVRLVGSGRAGDDAIMDANLELSPAPDGGTRVALRGSWHLPTGWANPAARRSDQAAAARQLARAILAEVTEWIAPELTGHDIAVASSAG